MKHPRSAIPAMLCTALLATGCNTYDTLDSTRATCGNPDETNPHYGQPYYLPKTMLRLQIAKTRGGGGGDEKAANVNTQTVNVYPPGQAVPAPPPKDDKPDATGGKVAYTITVTSETVPDYETGVLYVHYNQNWFYSEEVKIGVNDKNLLATSETISSDRTAQVIYNLADTAANLIKAASTDPFGAGLVAKGRVPYNAAGKKVAYRELNVDFRFDPFKQGDIDRLEALFKDASTDDTFYVAPFRVRLRDPKVVLADKKPKGRKGLYFREPVAVQLEIDGREEVYIDQVEKSLKSARPYADALTAKRLRPTPAVPPVVPAPGGVPEPPAPPAPPPADETAATEHADQLKAQLEVAKGTIDHRTERMTLSAHHKKRVYAYNVARSGFVQGKKQTLTIVDGSLRGVHMVKPSEAEGFSEIPLRLSEKVLALPKDILTLRQDITTKQGDILKQKTNAVNEQTNLNNALANQSLAQETGRLQAEKSRLQAELELLKLKKEGLPPAAAK